MSQSQGCLLRCRFVPAAATTAAIVVVVLLYILCLTGAGGVETDGTYLVFIVMLAKQLNSCVLYETWSDNPLIVFVFF